MYPLVGLLYHFLNLDGNQEILKDSLWTLMVIPWIFSRKRMSHPLVFNRSIFIFLLVGVGVLFFKFLLGFLLKENQAFYIAPYLMEMKGWLFLLVAIAWLKKFGAFPLEVFKNGAFFLSSLYIIFSIYLFTTGNFYRFGLASESNYDGLLILLGYIVCLREEKFEWVKLTLTIATFLTLSKTGILIWLVLTLFRYRKNIKYIVLIIPMAILFSLIVLVERGINDLSSVEQTDRFVFLYQAGEIFKDMDLIEKMVGIVPGNPIKTRTIIPEFQWFINHFNDLNNIRGIHSFMFHSFWLRSFISLGIPVTFLMILYFGRNILSRRTSFVLKALCFLILVQGFSMALFHITLIGVPLILFLLLVVIYYEKYDQLNLSEEYKS